MGMKTTLLNSAFIAGVASFFLFANPSAATDPGAAAEALLSLERDAAGARFLSISNAADQVWIVERSTNLTTWTELEAVKIHNGRFRRALTNFDSGTEQFFRAYFNSARQDLVSYVTN